MLTIKIFGPGCANCRKLEEIASRALQEARVEGEIVKVTDMKEIIGHDVFKTPGLSINGKLVSTGRIPAPQSMLAWIREAAI
jgi:small redox-active disulfide protein 2